ncbi:MAG: S1-like domain-containing RNA-binding protein [Candidatus Amulumruptor caecigallinarius]|nr:S1-like domain-containing RNA-binding protein [Candidatus Amulumruptor caecigallinarius]MCM1396200.1 S1-like domain-containing RNA-binding protein [Candidatus Amulumruptor caecigallinarius]MCM1453800.1 S1-like domain-containing RNA-binding protein [bacterium]
MKVRIGDYNELEVKKIVDFGLYLDAGDDTEILLPARYITEPVEPGDLMRVFVYTDSEDRLIATTEHPFARVGEFAFLQAVEVNKIGAFLDWGLPKDLLVPYREQKVRMRPGCQYLVYLYLDDATHRVAASAKIEKFLGNVLPEYKTRDHVQALVIAHDELGYRVIVDNLHRGIIYENEVYQPLAIGELCEACVKRVRPDGKIDVTLNERVGVRIAPLEEQIIDLIRTSPEGILALTDKSSPEQIKESLHCSKKDFKRAVGALYKARRIVLTPSGLTLP